MFACEYPLTRYWHAKKRPAQWICLTLRIDSLSFCFNLSPNEHQTLQRRQYLPLFRSIKKTPRTSQHALWLRRCNMLGSHELVWRRTHRWWERGTCRRAIDCRGSRDVRVNVHNENLCSCCSQGTCTIFPSDWDEAKALPRCIIIFLVYSECSGLKFNQNTTQFRSSTESEITIN